MKKKAYIKNQIRTISKTKARFLSIFCIVFLGAAFFAGLRHSPIIMKESMHDYLEEYKWNDLEYIGTLGFEQKLIDDVKSIDGVDSVDYGFRYDVLIKYKDQVNIGATVYTDDNFKEGNCLPELKSGKYPEKDNECLMDYKYATKNNIALNQQIVATNDYGTKTYKVVGTCNDTRYICSFERGTNTLGDGNNGLFLLTLTKGNEKMAVPESLIDLHDSKVFYNDLRVRLKNPSQYYEFDSNYDDYIKPYHKKIKKLFKDYYSDFYTDVKTKANKKIEDGQKDYDQGLKDYQDGLTQYQDGKKKYDDGIKEYNDGLAKYQSGLQQYNQGYNEYQKGYSQYQTGLQQYNQGYKEYQKGYQQYQSGLQQYNQGYIVYQDNLTKYQAGLQQYDQGEKDYQNGMTQYQEGLSQYNVGYEEYQNKLAQYNQALEQYNTNMITVQAGLDQVGGYEAAKQKKAYLESVGQTDTPDYQNLVTLINSYDALVVVKQQLDQQYPLLQQAEKELAENKAKLDATKQQLDQARIQLDQNKTLLETTKQQLDQAKVKLDQNKALLDSTKQQLDQAKNKLDKSKALLDSTKHKLDQAKQQLVSNKQLLDETKVKLDQAKSQLDSAKKQLDESLPKLTDAKEKLADAKVKLADAKKHVKDLVKGKAIGLTRKESVAILSFDGNCESIAALSILFPTIFFLVAALVSMTTMTRMVEELRVQNGTFRALGYRKSDVILQYLIYAFLATFFASCLGTVFGTYFFPSIIFMLYRSMMFDVGAPTRIVFETITCLQTFGISVVIIMVVTFAVCYKELNEVPAQILRPKAPKLGKRIILERITFIWKRLSFNQKVTMRNIFRYKKRFFMSVIGIAGCTALIVVGFGIKGSVSPLAGEQYSSMWKYDGIVSYDSHLNDIDMSRVKKEFAGQKEVKSTLGIYTKMISVDNQVANIEVPETTKDFDQYVHMADYDTGKTLKLKDDGVYINAKLSEILDVKKGDTITITLDKEDYKVKVAGVYKLYFRHYIYMSKDYYHKITNETPEFNYEYYIEKGDKNKSDKALETFCRNTEGINSTSSVSGIAEAFVNQMESLDSVVIILIVCAGSLAFVVLYNLTNINIQERKSEIATIKVLGFYPKEVYDYVFRENIILAIIGSLVGLVLGKLIHGYLIRTVEIDMAMFIRTVSIPSYLYAILLTMLFTFLINRFMRRVLSKIDMVESLKSIE